MNEIEILRQFMSEKRINRINSVLAKRTRFVTVVLEDIYHPPNASAVLRTSECLGIQDLHIIENTKAYKPNSDVAIGASKWLTLHRYKGTASDNTETCICALRKKGYKLAAAVPENNEAISLYDLPTNSPTAFCFGTEETGLSKKLIDAADYRITIPMYGFTESFNISVAAAICLSSFIQRVRKDNRNIALPEEEKKELALDWHRKSVKNYQQILEHLKQKDESI